MVPFIFANAFDEIGIGKQRERYGGAPSFCIGLGIIECDLDFHASEVQPAETLRDAQFLAVRMSRIVKPTLVVEAYSLGNKRIAFPFSDRVPKPTRIRFWRKGAAITENLSIVIELFVENDEHAWSLNQLERRIAHEHA